MTEPNIPLPDDAPPISEPEGEGLAPNVAGALAYLLGPITGILFLVVEKKSDSVRFHAAQSVGIFVAWIVFAVVWTVLTTVLGFLPWVGWILAILFAVLSVLLGLAGLGLWLFLMYRAWQGREWEFPWVGRQARKILLEGARVPGAGAGR